MIHFAGSWRLERPLPSLDTLRATLQRHGALQQLRFDTSRLADWDSGLAAYVAALQRLCEQQGIHCELDGLPAGLRALLALTGGGQRRNAEEGIAGEHVEESRSTFVRRFGLDIIDLFRSTGEIMAFFGEGVIALRRFLHGRARFRRSELWLIIQESGADALPIVGLVSFLVGMILGYIGDQQLAQFGVRIYVADLVGLGTVIQMGALITAIVMAGRTGAAFAAQIGTMQVNEEIDALRTLGISPMEFLVLPRMLALILMTPLLAIYADLLGILGGAFVGTTIGGLTLTAYLIQTQSAIAWNHIAQGLISATVYGAIVAASGCLRGMQCGRSAAAVGQATTSAVVTAIVFITIAAAVLTILFDAVGLS
ncbi:ABC transporter permease [Thiohalocapsa marina]|uniref:ABC transporter permease n=1 Tax=Thiohalocapsa marina TaxID=424902 RepID=UPI001FE41237|nr:ABC transporter permease [Thiohalocapsa marina]